MTYIMEEEIKSQSEIIGNLIKKYIKDYKLCVPIDAIPKRIMILASGSSYNAGLFGENFFENISQIETEVEYASEFSNSKFNNFNSDTFYIFISQSGQSSDSLIAMEKVKKDNVKTLSITNNPDSIMKKNSDYSFLLEAGRENAIAATKTFSATVCALWLLALQFAQNKNLDISNELEGYQDIEDDIKNAFLNTKNIDKASKLLSKQDAFSIVASGINYPIAREAALKIKETSYISTGSYPMGEFVHGHFALLNKLNVFLGFFNSNISENEVKLYRKITSTYKTHSVIVSDGFIEKCDILVELPKCNSRIAKIFSSIQTLQLLALNIATMLGRDVDKPKGLNKVVENK